jgi:hypothetical protein
MGGGKYGEKLENDDSKPAGKFQLHKYETSFEKQEPEPVFVNDYGAQESIPRNQFGQGCHKGPPGCESIPGLLKRFTNTGSDVLYKGLATMVPSVEKLYCQRPIQCLALASSKILVERGRRGQYFGRCQTQLCTLQVLCGTIPSIHMCLFYF